MQIDKKNKRTITRRLFLLKSFYMAFIGINFGKTYSLQIMSNEKYNQLSEKNYVKTYKNHALRGMIFDCNHFPLAINKKIYNLLYDPKINSSLDYILDKLNQFLHKKIDKNKLINIREKIILYKNIPWEEIVNIEFNFLKISGIEIIESYKRYYSIKTMSNIIGYVAKDIKSSYYKPINGLEFFKNDILEGFEGIEKYKINAKNEIINKIDNIESIIGNNLEITLNSNLQRYINKEFEKYANSGSVVVLNVNNGHVKAMNTYPIYDNNLFVDGISLDDWNMINNDKLYPMINRAVSLQIAPGSIFKIIVAVAAIEEKLINNYTTYICKGYVDVGNHRFHCWNKNGHGLIKSLDHALTISCNSYFYNIALKFGLDVDSLFYYAELLGFNTIYNLPLNDIKKGNLPSKKWRKEQYKSWTLGDTINSIIGQGYLLATPLQFAILGARIASGKVVIPEIICDNDGSLFDDLKINKANLYNIKNAMYKVINSKIGTARKAKSNLVKIAGKTGTTQLTNTRNTSVVNHGEFIGFFPFDNPKYSISVILEHGKSGANASMFAKNIIEYIVKKNI